MLPKRDADRNRLLLPQFIRVHKERCMDGIACAFFLDRLEGAAKCRQHFLLTDVAVVVGELAELSH